MPSGLQPCHAGNRGNHATRKSVKLRGYRLDNKALPNRLHSGSRVTSRTERFIASFHQFLGQSLQRGGVSYAVHPGHRSCSPWALQIAKFLNGLQVKPAQEALDSAAPRS